MIGAAFIICLAFSLQTADADRDLKTKLLIEEARTDHGPETTKLFIRVEQVYRLPQEQRRSFVEELYREIYPSLLRTRLYSEGGTGERPAYSDQCSPEELAAKISSHWHWHVMHAIAMKSCEGILRDHQGIVEEMVRTNLAANTHVALALRTARAFRLVSTIGEVIHVFESNSKWAELAANTLGRLSGGSPQPRAIQALLRNDPTNATRYSQELRMLSAGHPADPELIAILQSQNSEHRAQAAYALSESTGELLFAQLGPLVHDSDPGVRAWAGSIALNLNRRGKLAAKPYAVYLLGDAERSVRRHIALELAYEKDPLAVRPLLELLGDGQEGNPTDIINALAYQLGPDEVYGPAKGPREDDINEIVGRISSWIEKHLSPEPEINFQYETR